MSTATFASATFAVSSLIGSTGAVGVLTGLASAGTEAGAWAKAPAAVSAARA